MVKSISRPFLLQFRNVAPDCADEAMAAAIWPLTIPPREPALVRRWVTQRVPHSVV